jgi:hypothetical protein
MQKGQILQDVDSDDITLKTKLGKSHNARSKMDALLEFNQKMERLKKHP